jgi:hypothetical protein
MFSKQLPVNYKFIQVLKKKETTCPIHFFSWLYNDQYAIITTFYKQIIFLHE